MTQKAKRRKLEEGKDTVFKLEGKLWNRDRTASTLSRIEEFKVSENLAGKFHTIGLLQQESVKFRSLKVTDAETPESLSYKTPKALVDPPSANGVEEHCDAERIEISDDQPENGFDASTFSRPLDGSKLTLT